jgi:hypothetical protein
MTGDGKQDQIKSEAEIRQSKVRFIVKCSFAKCNTKGMIFQHDFATILPEERGYECSGYMDQKT